MFLVYRLVLMLMYPAAARSIKGKLCLSKRSWKYVCRRHKMGQSYTSLTKEYSLRKSTIHDIVQSEDRLTEYMLKYNMLQDQKEALLKDSSSSFMIFTETNHCLVYLL